ncbi:MAG: hypothetical protein KKH22_11850 [Proteobacteria bacterium]|nr:hypothetical protein [Pseudomonadota bacterium]
MIPNFNHSGVLPPFLPGHNPTSGHAVAPYKVSLMDFVEKFCTSPARHRILTGFIEYRLALKQIGIDIGFQWIDGSFVENIEATKGKNPSDLDIITFAHRPEKFSDNAAWHAFVTENRDLFSPEALKKSFLCDGYHVDLNLPSVTIVNRTSYWFGLFSHQRETFLWKGLLEINMQEQEVPAQQFLANGGHHAS